MPKNKNKTDSTVNARNIALKLLLEVCREGHSLSALNHLTEGLDARDIAFARMLSFGVLRFYFQLQALLKPLMKKALKEKDLDVQLVMMMALYQLVYSRVPDYAVVDAAVTQMRKSKKQWAAKLVNAVLRNFIRQQAELISNLNTDEAKYAHPQWMIDYIKQDWPDVWQAILEANNRQAPMTLRVNQQKTTRDDYQQLLASECELTAESIDGIPSALMLSDARDVTQLPGYNDGWFSVQDAGAQLAAQILQPAAGDHILDACAAPGGKTAHLYEKQKDIQVTALDISASRLVRVAENCSRLGFTPQIIEADASDVASWWQGELFDKILLDVPCSASGVIRRHPDIKLLRRADDIAALVELQRQILLKNWSLLKPGGYLLYATCSLFKIENEQQINWFLSQFDDASVVDISDRVPPVQSQMENRLESQLQMQDQITQQNEAKLPLASIGHQLFPISQTNDGFYYALLAKSSAGTNLN